MMPKFEDYQRLIISRAWAWKSATGWELDDLIGEGNLCFCKILPLFDSEKATFSTFLYNSLQFHFQNIVNMANFRGRREPVYPYHDVFYTHYEQSSEEISLFWEIIFDLPNDAKEVVKAIFETPYEIIEVMEIERITKNVLFQYFTRFRGWKQKRVWKAYKEIDKRLLAD